MESRGTLAVKKGDQLSLSAETYLILELELFGGEGGSDPRRRSWCCQIWTP